MGVKVGDRRRYGGDFVGCMWLLTIITITTEDVAASMSTTPSLDGFLVRALPVVVWDAAVGGCKWEVKCQAKENCENRNV